ncbi:hypothetical protein C8Q77DRAFT_776579 [Trametes polyzona]|nr:hypothetical protein C8Q77DRAFT_776579 [Trametes polyzona]
MERLPLEISQRIFELACTDGGYTGQSLGLASKTFRAISRTARFHSVLLAASPHRLRAFLALYERECDPALGDKPRIRHLHVTFPRIEEHPPEAAADEDSEDEFGFPRLNFAGSLMGRRSRSVSPPLRQGQEKGRASAEPDGLSTGIPPPGEALERALRYSDGSKTWHLTADPAYKEAARNLLRLAGPDLVTLVIQCGYSFGGPLHLPGLIKSPLPHLREATFVGITGLTELLRANDAEGGVGQPLFPALTHLSLLSPSKPLNMSFWRTHAPNVAHLSLSHAEYCTLDIAAAVGVRVGEHPRFWHLNPSTYPDGAADSTGPRPVPIYPSLRRLVLQPSAGPVMAGCGDPWMDYGDDLAYLEEVAQSCQAVGVDAVVVKAPTSGEPEVQYRWALRGWLERIENDRDGLGTRTWG